MFHYVEQLLDHLRRLAHMRGGKTEQGKQATTVEEALHPIEVELEEVVKTLKGMQPPITPKDLRGVREVLGHIDATYHEGRFDLPGVQGVPAGQARCAQLLSEAHDLLRERLEASEFYRVSPQLRSYHDKLENIITALEDIKANKPDVKPKDLLVYRKKLAEIDAHYTSATFDVGQGQGQPEGVAIVAEQLNTAHSRLRELLDKTDFYAVDEALQPMYSRLDGVQHALEGLKARGGVSDKDLAKYRHVLEKVDAQYKDAKFEVAGGAPAGQAVLAEMLEKTHGMMNEVQQMVA